MRISMRKQRRAQDEQRGDLGLCQTSDASAAIKPVPRPRKKGYAVDVLTSAHASNVEARLRLKHTSEVLRS